MWGDRLVRAAGLTALGFMTRTSNWFPETDMRQAVVALAPVLARYPDRVLFGHSIGGYGAIKYSRLLAAPQLSVFALNIPAIRMMSEISTTTNWRTRDIRGRHRDDPEPDHSGRQTYLAGLLATNGQSGKSGTSVRGA